MAKNPYQNDVVISWAELHRDTRYLSHELHQLGQWKGIIAITRGGLVPAALVARELEIRLIETFCVASYGTGKGGGAAQDDLGVAQCGVLLREHRDRGALEVRDVAHQRDDGGRAHEHGDGPRVRGLRRHRWHRYPFVVVPVIAAVARLSGVGVLDL